MSTEQQLNNLAEDVREEGLNQGNSMKDLVFDPVTGDFRQVPRGTHHGEGDVVTEMTNKGFAAEAETRIVYLREDELAKAVEMLGKKKHIPAFVEEVDEEGVFHVAPGLSQQVDGPVFSVRAHLHRVAQVFHRPGLSVLRKGAVLHPE